MTSLTNVSGGATFASYTYDAAGNQLTRSYPPTNELWEYVYDDKDQLHRATRKLAGAVTASEEYWYDAFGQRIAVVKRNAAGAKTELVWFIGDVQAHYNAAGTVTKIYSHLSLGTPVARVERTGESTSSLEFQFHGLASSTIAAVAQSGTINASFSYAPFGELLEATSAGGAGQGTAVHKRRFNDKIEDDIGGLAYYGARYYDKTLIGWTQADPLYRFAPDAAWASPRRANLYAFSLNNSLRYIDPDGRDVMLVGRSQPTGDLNLNIVQIQNAAGRAGSFTAMSTNSKTSRVVASGGDIKKALDGRADAKVAYFGHAALDSANITPEGNLISPSQLAGAINGMSKQPTDIYLFGCNTQDTGFSKELAAMLPGTTIHGFEGDFDVVVQGPEVNGQFDKTKAVINPKRHKKMRSQLVEPAKQQKPEKRNRPADANGDGCGSFTARLDERSSDHLTSLRCGRLGGSGLGTSPPA